MIPTIQANTGLCENSIGLVRCIPVKAQAPYTFPAVSVCNIEASSKSSSLEKRLARRSFDGDSSFAQIISKNTHQVLSKMRNEDLLAKPQQKKMSGSIEVESNPPVIPSVKNLQRKIPAGYATKNFKDPIRADMVMRYRRLNEDPSYSHLEEETKCYLAERFAGSWSFEDKTEEFSSFAKKLIENRDPKYSHLGESTRRIIVQYVIDGSIDRDLSANEIAKKAVFLSMKSIEF